MHKTLGKILNPGEKPEYPENREWRGLLTHITFGLQFHHDLTLRCTTDSS